MKEHNKVLLPLNKAQRGVAPRIPHLVTTVDRGGRVNTAPFSNITSVSTKPERLVLAITPQSDTYKNLRATKQFVVNMPSVKLLDAVWICGDKYTGHPIPAGIDELCLAGLTAIPARKVKPPRIAECAVHLECSVVWMKKVGNHYLVLADIVAFSATKGTFNKDHIPQIKKVQPLFEISSGYFTTTGAIHFVAKRRIHRFVEAALRKLSK